MQIGEELYQMLSFYYFTTNSESSCKILLGVDSFSVLRRHGFSHSEEDISENTRNLEAGLAGGVRVSLLVFR